MYAAEPRGEHQLQVGITLQVQWPAKLGLRRSGCPEVSDHVCVRVSKAGDHQVEDYVGGDSAAVGVHPAGRHPAVVLPPLASQDLHREVWRLGLLVLLSPAFLLPLQAAFQLTHLNRGSLVAEAQPAPPVAELETEKEQGGAA